MMLVDTDNLVSSEEFRRDLDKYVSAAQEGRGPVAVTKGSKVVGFFIGPDDYEAMFGAAVKELLAARMTGPTVSHGEVREQIRKRLRDRRSS